MINIVFKVEKGFSTYPNRLLPINNDYDMVNDYVAFGNLSKTNVFIGENNSGKSRFLRELFSSKCFGLTSQKVDEFCNALRRCDNDMEEHMLAIEKFNFLYEKHGQSYSMSSFHGNDFFSILSRYGTEIMQQNRFYFPAIRGVKDYKTIINNKLKNFLQSTKSIQNQDSINHYISLLNLESTGLESFDVYQEITIKEYFNKHTEVKNNVLTGGTLYQEIKSMLLGDESQRKLIAEFQLFLQKQFFYEYGNVQLIPREQEKVLYVKIGDQERAVYDWGDGTQQLIIILFALFKHKDEENKLFFIEEPEMYMHPGILRKFVETINLDVFKNHQYFITTHSNAILDISADSWVDMSIFKFKKIWAKERDGKDKFVIEQCNNGDVSLLNELGVRNSSVFLSNCSIWVEGVTDRLYLKHYLNLYTKKYSQKPTFRENIDYTFIEYGGGNLPHFNFDIKDSECSINARYINNKIFLIVDNDKTKPNTRRGKRKAYLRDVLKANFYELSCLEVENLISRDILIKVLIKQNPQKTEIINQKFSNKKDFSNKKLGDFLDKLFEGNLRKYAGESGAINQKVQFCTDVIEATTDYDSLSEEAKLLTEKIYMFISSNNN